MDANHVAAYGITVQLVLSLIHHFVRSPQRQAQIDALQQKIDDLTHVLLGGTHRPQGAGKDGN